MLGKMTFRSVIQPLVSKNSSKDGYELQAFTSGVFTDVVYVVEQKVNISIPFVNHNLMSEIKPITSF